MVEAGTRRGRQARERRAQLLVTALSLFAEKGVEGTSMRDLAAAAAVSQGTIYHYFADKDALLVAVVEAHSFLPHLRRLLTCADSRPSVDVLRDLVLSFAALLDEHARIVQVLVGEAGIRPTLAATWTGLTEEGVSLLAGYLDTRIAAGELRPHDAAVTARAVFFTVLMAHLARTPPTPFLPMFVDVLVQGIAARVAGATGG